jgi:hypothetical protein
MRVKRARFKGVNMRTTNQLSLIAISLVFVACAEPASEEGETAIEKANLVENIDSISAKSALSLKLTNEVLRRLPEFATTSCVVRVAGRGGNDANTGASWSAPMATVQAAIERAQSLAVSGGTVCNVWIRSGTYAPPTTAGFTLRPKVGLYGGFRGNENSTSQRLAGYKSTLNGVVTVNMYAVGVVDAIRFPATVTVESGSLGFNDCNFYGTGAAIVGQRGSLAISNSEFSNTGNAVSCQCGISVSSSTFYNGGRALYTGGANSISVTGSTFTGVGSGISVGMGYITVSGSAFRLIPGSALTISDGTMKVSDSVFEEIDGYPIRVDAGGVTVDNCKFWNNASTCVAISGNPGTATVSKSTFNGNFASTASVGSISGSYGYLTFASSILWGNDTNVVTSSGRTYLSIDNSDVEGGFAGSGILNVDPQFVDPAIGDLRLAASSPLIGLNWGYQ